MAASDRRLDPGSSNLAIFAVSAVVAIAVGVLTYQPIPDVQSADRDVGIVEPAGVSPRCLEADRASVAQLAAILERNGPAVAPIQERATHTLSIARRHCLYGWQERALEDYAWLTRWLSEQG
jgi:hypothetical protein